MHPKRLSAVPAELLDGDDAGALRKPIGLPAPEQLPELLGSQSGITVNSPILMAFIGSLRGITSGTPAQCGSPASGTHEPHPFG